MGITNSKIEEDKALQMCRERKKFVRQALDGRCALAAAHVDYIQSLEAIGIALRRFVEPEAPNESSLYTSTSATPEPLALTEKSLSQFSFSSPSLSQRVDATEALSPTPSPPYSSHIQLNHMKIRGSYSRKVEEKPSLPVMGTVTSSSTPQNTTPRSTGRPEMTPFEASSLPPSTPPWDFFHLFPSVDNQFSSQGGELNQGLDTADDITQLRKEEGIPELEDEEDKVSFHGEEESQDSEDEFDEPSTDTLVRSFENLNRVPDHVAASSSPTMPSTGSVASETGYLNGEKSNSPGLSPLRSTSSAVALHSDVRSTPVKENGIENKVAPKDFFSSIRDIEYLFVKASESGKEVPRMLEANKFHFRPIFPQKDSGSVTSTLFKACFSCGEDPTIVQEEPAQAAMKYLTWHRTASSRSSSSRNPLGSNSKDDIEDLTSNLFDNFCMTSGSHASTLDRLFAWERKLYDEVKASEMIRRDYDMKCKILRQLESKGESSNKIDKTRAVVKDLHSRIRVAIHRINSISKRIEELRDTELEPQLEELISGLSRMWEGMFECHRLQYHIISVAYNNGTTKISIQSESHRQFTIHLGTVLSSLSSSFAKWIGAQKSYLQAINGWLVKCVPVEEKSSKKKRRRTSEHPLRDTGPPIYAACDVWLDMLDKLPTKELTDSIKGLASETSFFLPRQEKSQDKSKNKPHSTDPHLNILRDDAPPVDWVSGFERFQSSLARFLEQLNNFAESSVKMYGRLEQTIKDSRARYERSMSQPNNTVV